MDFILKYWAQITVLVGVIGYILKGYWDFKIKKLEIKSTLVFKERLKIISKFYSCYMSWQSHVKILIEHKLSIEKDSPELLKAHLQAWKDFIDTFHKITLFIPSENKDFSELKVIGVELQKAYFKFSENDVNKESIKVEVETLNKKAIIQIAKIISYFNKEFGIN